MGKSNQKKKKIVRYGVVILLLIYYFCLPTPLFDTPYATVVNDAEGKLIGARIAQDGQWRFSPSYDVPDKVVKALLLFEDEYFYWHWGVNPVAILRAVKQNIVAKRIVSGGSTLTMQTVRLARNRARTFSEKLVEVIWATRLEFRYSKKEILNLYVAHAPFGGNVVGIEAASWRYFGHEAQDLSWAEAATLAVLPNSPSMIHLAKRRGELKEKRDRLLQKMWRKSLLSREDYLLAVDEPLPEKPHPMPQYAPHLVTHYFLHSPGKTHRTTLDLELQKEAESLLLRWNREFKRSDIRNIAAIVVDVWKNEVVSYCGNINFERGKEGQVDVINSPRSSGSILKPFLYGAMLSEGMLLPQTLLPDIPVTIDGFSPQNYNLQFEGAVPADEALARSLNIPSVFLLKEYTVPKFYNLLKQFGLTTLTNPASHYGLSLILGGAECKLGEVTAAYVLLGRKVQNLPGVALNLYGKPTSQHTGVDIPLSKGAIWQTLNALKEVNRPEEIDWKSISSMRPISWKTGTSYGFRDGWAVGLNQRYAIGVWVGNATGEGKVGLTGARTAAPVMFDLFNLLPEAHWFNEPEGEFIDVEICKKSGHLSGRYCEEKETIHALPVGIRSEVCPYHHEVWVTPDGKYQVYQDCVDQLPVVQQKWFTLPPVWEWYYKKHHADYRVLPPLMDGCIGEEHLPMQFIYPQDWARISLPKQLDGSAGRLTFDLVHSVPSKEVYWHLNGVFVGTTKNIHKYTAVLLEGKHNLTVVDEDGNTLSISFTIM